MNKFYVIGGVVLVAFVLYSGWVKNRVHEQKSLAYSDGDRMESFTLPSIEGEAVSLEEALKENRIVWVNFWATWCGPCRREMPMMSELYEKYKDKGFSILAISVREEQATVEQYLEEHPVPFPVLLDTAGTLAKQFNVEALPTSFLVDSTGVVKQTGVGVQDAWQYYLQREFQDE